jgi:S-adenosylmethionine:tRNA ribosyltransferase-isomerase
MNKPIKVDYLLTNFHLPKSTLIMLVASFIGLEKTLELYNIAIKENYRFYSYGDGMLII